jgi:hypothetical protein
MRTIMHANHLHFLLPFALPTAADAPTALHDLESPALEKLLARANLVERVALEDFQRTLPHERWVARQFSATTSLSTDDEAPLAPYMLLADGGPPGETTWACVQPVHVQVARGHGVLIDPASLDLSDDEAATLLAVAKPLIEDLGVRIEAPSPTRWYLSSDTFGALASASPLRASGRNIEIWLPHDAHTGERSRAWMKLQNEIQMAWFEHPLNTAREARGLPAINSIWMHAQGAMQTLKRPFVRVLSEAPATRGLALAAGAEALSPPASFDTLQAAANGATLIELDACSSPFLAQNWARWSAALNTLERTWFAPALAALQRRQIDQLGITLCGDAGSSTLTVTRGDLRKFWRRRALASLFE